eukprot:scaffold3808_cov112-Isochrysis_galbana.AAC.45
MPMPACHISAAHIPPPGLCRTSLKRVRRPERVAKDLEPVSRVETEDRSHQMRKRVVPEIG